jgi:AraC-like DNA-binding protein
MAATSTFVRFSMNAAGRDPVRALHDINERHIVFPLEALAGRRVHADIAVRARPDLRIMSAAFAGVSQGGGLPEGRDAADDELMLAATLSGHSVLRQRGREVALADGDGLLFRRGDGPFSVTHPGRVRFLGIRIPRRVLAPLVGRVDDALMRRIPGENGVLGLLASYLPAALGSDALGAPDSAESVARHVHDLVALIAGATGDAAAIAASRGLRAARLRAIRADVLANLDDVALSVAAVAARRGVSPRYVHKLFEGTAATFSQFVLEQRLIRAYRMLTDPRRAGETVSTVAFAVGFGDLSYFNRTFRRRYGATPSDVRRGRGS